MIDLAACIDAITARAAGVLFVTEDKALFIRRVGGHDPHAGEWSIPAGSIEADEAPAAAAQREARAWMTAH